ncbi:hypothetical protein HNP55_003043 [Paucibacter oligotrophus]|uniref:Uncharacterized protein n=1 Tax=Roseateles oligotrophus TaxID=1769250 RepID=A0A840LEL5_9BURK|nr:hypothetical protein [Roseateles oligotrophus]MBB4844499.1 hypothetical protein [Roseateles oligotrophus]
MGDSTGPRDYSPAGARRRFKRVEPQADGSLRIDVQTGGRRVLRLRRGGDCR